MLPIRSSRAKHLWDALSAGYQAVGFWRATGCDAVFKQLVLGRLVEPVSEFDTIRVLGEMGISAASYAAIKRRLSVFSEPQWRRRFAVACASHVNLGPRDAGVV